MPQQAIAQQPEHSSATDRGILKIPAHDVCPSSINAGRRMYTVQVLMMATSVGRSSNDPSNGTKRGVVHMSTLPNPSFKLLEPVLHAHLMKDHLNGPDLSNSHLPTDDVAKAVLSHPAVVP
jgi:hypothetical protein